MSTVDDATGQPSPEPQASWVDESIERYANPIAFARANAPLPEPVVQGEKMLTSASGGQPVKLTTALLKERPFWSKVSLVWTFRLADVEGSDDSSRVVVLLSFDTWTGAVQISENNLMKVDEIQRPIIGGSWRTKTDFGTLEIKIVPFWTGYQYELWFEGAEVYSLFT